VAEIALQGVNKRFGASHVIHDVDLRIRSGEFCVFVGPSGCGKSTLLRLVAGLEATSSGDLSIDGRRVNDVPPKSRGVAMVFQSYALYPHMTVYENMAFGLRLGRASRETVRGRVEEAAQLLQLGDLLERRPRQLSGGQRQRVAIGRAIVRHPQVFLFDEPLSNLDAALRVQMRLEIARLHQRLQTTMIYVTHDQLEAMTLADRIVVLQQGYVEQVGAPLVLYHHPRNTFVAGFIGSPRMNLLAGRLVQGGAGGALVQLGGGSEIAARVDASQGRAGDAVTLGIRPEHLQLEPHDVDGAALEGQIIRTEHLGDHALIYVQVPGLDEPLTVKVDTESRFADGARVRVSLPASSCHLFDDQGRAFARLARPGGVAPPQDQEAGADARSPLPNIAGPGSG